MADEINQQLKNICRKLSSGDVCNFQADIKIFQTDKLPGFEEVEIIKNILGGDYVDVGEVERTDLFEALKIVKECLEFTGDEGAHPNKKYVFSDEFKLETNQVLEKINLLFPEDDTEIFSFWLKHGHPFYPVFWDYAFLLRKSENDFVFIGSSSD